MPKKYIITNINNVNPTPNNDTTAGYSLAQNWFNESSGELFYHKASGVWVSYASTNSVGESPVMFADVATTTQFNGTYNNGVGGVGATLIRTTNGILDVDNVRLNLGVVVLVKDQPEGDIDLGIPNLQYQNGVYVVTQAGTSVVPVILTRVDFADASDELFPSQVNILDGSVNQNKFFLQETENPAIGSSSIVYTTNLIPPVPEVITPVVFVDTATTEPLPSCTYANIYNPVIPGQWWTTQFPIDATITATANGPLGTINGVVMGNTVANRNNRILVKNQVNPAHNGDYRVVNAGSATTPWVLQRITKNGGSMITSVREWKVNNENSTLYGNRYNLNSDLRFFKLGLTNIEFSEIENGVTLGLIKIVDKSGEKFTDLATAGAYIRTFTNAAITDESFSSINKTYWFTVPNGSSFTLANNFLNNSNAYIVDELEIIAEFGDSAFLSNTGNNILGNCTFGTNAFRNSEGNNTLGNCTFTSYAFHQSIGNNVLGDCIFTSKALEASSGNNILGNCTFTTDAFRLATGNNILGDCTFGNTAFYNVSGNNEMGMCSFGTSAFVSSSGDNILGNCTFTDNAFQVATGNNILGNCTFGDPAFYGTTGINRFRNILLSTSTFNFASNSSGRFEIYGNIGTDETANYPNFFPSSTAVIWAQKVKETSNAGGIEGDLVTARTNGAKLFFGYALSGSGTTNYITKWTPDGTSLGNSTAYEDSSGRWGIGTTGTTFAQLNISTPQISGRESILTTQVDDNILDRYILANGTTTSSRFIPTHVGFVDGTYQSLIFRGLGLSANDSGTNPYVEFRAATTSSSTDPNNGVLLNPTIKPLFSWGSVTEAMRIVANGNVGIGTTLPTSTLHVSSFTNVAQFEYVGFTGTNNFKFTSSIINDEISLEATRNSVTTQLIGYDDNNKAFFNSYSVVSSGGLVGIGVTGPTAKLHVAASTTLAAMMRLEVGTAPTSPNDGDVWLESNTTTGLKIQLGGVTRTITIT